MTTVVNLVNEADPCSAVALVVLLYTVGGLMVQHRPTLRVWGLRLATAAFLAFAGYRLTVAAPQSADAALVILARGLYAGGLVLGCAWVVLAVSDFLYAHMVRPVTDFLDRRRQRREERAAAARARLAAEEERRWRAEAEARAAPEREQAAWESQRQAQAEAAAQARREDARARCELLYTLHAPEIGARLPRAAFDDFVRRYLGDQHRPEEVERRAVQLQDIIFEHLARTDPSAKFRSLADIAAWYEAQVREIESLPDARAKDSLTARLNIRYAELTAEFLEGRQ